MLMRSMFVCLAACAAIACGAPLGIDAHPSTQALSANDANTVGVSQVHGVVNNQNVTFNSVIFATGTTQDADGTTVDAVHLLFSQADDACAQIAAGSLSPGTQALRIATQDVNHNHRLPDFASFPVQNTTECPARATRGLSATLKLISYNAACEDTAPTATSDGASGMVIFTSRVLDGSQLLAGQLLFVKVGTQADTLSGLFQAASCPALLSL